MLGSIKAAAGKIGHGLEVRRRAQLARAAPRGWRCVRGAPSDSATRRVNYPRAHPCHLRQTLVDKAEGVAASVVHKIKGDKGEAPSSQPTSQPTLLALSAFARVSGEPLPTSSLALCQGDRTVTTGSGDAALGSVSLPLPIDVVGGVNLCLLDGKGGVLGTASFASIEELSKSTSITFAAGGAAYATAQVASGTCPCPPPCACPAAQAAQPSEGMAAPASEASAPAAAAAAAAEAAPPAKAVEVQEPARA